MAGRLGELRPQHGLSSVTAGAKLLTPECPPTPFPGVLPVPVRVSEPVSVLNDVCSEGLSYYLQLSGTYH